MSRHNPIFNLISVDFCAIHHVVAQKFYYISTPKKLRKLAHFRQPISGKIEDYQEILSCHTKHLSFEGSYTLAGQFSTGAKSDRIFQSQVGNYWFFWEKNSNFQNFGKKFWGVVMNPWICAKVCKIIFLWSKLYGQEDEKTI